MKDNKIEVMKEKQGGSATLENVVLFAVSKKSLSELLEEEMDYYHTDNEMMRAKLNQALQG
ncbi:hypothetical protein ABNB59_13880 [Paenibacillus larvae]|uniref:Uncharacterized protein n=4 Tax=Paenibacillus larvae TaxID=1464 RepID=V9W6P8_9BACL|nr:hypothetical protein [Paenibacillus larvae]AHD05803.1 hypothetical protein ERIC2_c20101 [Paenibacillus larvae subsp. larvae DSM 25430]AQR76735.1 hypothetical protein BXP28_04345 [Paenibacillus larvae subsp. larvae]AQT83544.1 hypothetical protein B1222_02440 [Paenibacillus larvae subsp. pulvifaciens]AQZ48648.1 hypothetical protein B5S25_20815 [Paenibacillus larvae subsp. pulvifaciens]ARF70038.1 hypothetical protein B7C51_22580 [Paenibacillus larvae subsp. pulvifaciens]